MKFLFALMILCVPVLSHAADPGDIIGMMNDPQPHPSGCDLEIYDQTETRPGYFLLEIQAVGRKCSAQAALNFARNSAKQACLSEFENCTLGRAYLSQVDGEVQYYTATAQVR